MTPRAAIAVIAALAVVPAAGAQVCAGLAPFERHRPFQAVAAATKMHGDLNVGAGLALGNRAAFARLSAGRRSLQDRDKAALELTAAGGAEFPGGPRESVRVCFLGSLGVTPGPHDVMIQDEAGTSARKDVSSVDWSVGVTAGSVRSVTRGPLLFPTGSMSMVRAATRMKDMSSGAVRRDVRVFGIMELGVGVVVLRTIAVRPMLTIPIGLPRASYGASITVSSPLGW